MARHGPTDSVGDFNRFGLGVPGQKEHDFVAPVPHSGVVFPHAQHQQARDADQHFVSDLVRELVVDLFELVEIDEGATNGDFGTFAFFDQSNQAVFDECAIQ